EVAPGMFVILTGAVVVTQRDPSGEPELIVEQEAGEFLAEIGQLSRRPALVDARARGAVETVLVRPEQLRALMIAEAELGERIMRALILRRVSLIEVGAGPIVVGALDHPDVLRIENFLARNGVPQHTL